MTTVRDLHCLALMRAGSWKVSVLPPPVGKMAKNDSPSAHFV